MAVPNYSPGQHLDRVGKIDSRKIKGDGITIPNRQMRR